MSKYIYTHVAIPIYETELTLQNQNKDTILRSSTMFINHLKYTLYMNVKDKYMCQLTNYKDQSKILT